MSVEERLAKLETKVDMLLQRFNDELSNVGFYQKLIMILLAAVLAATGLSHVIP